MKKISSVTIGISAYNEEANIALLIGDILSQKQKSYSMKKILIISDGSSDATNSCVRKIKNKKVQFIASSSRLGLAKRENQIIKNTHTDILVFINADTRIYDLYCIEKLIHPIIIGKADITSPAISEFPPRTWFEKNILMSMRLKDSVFRKYKKGNNVYTCHGQMRAFSKKYLKNYFVPKSVGEDAYSYFYSIKNGFNFQSVHKTSVYYRLPMNITDHKKQSIRFFQSQHLLQSQFNKTIVIKEYALPKGLLFKSFMHILITDPFSLLIYSAMEIYLKIISFFENQTGDTWDISQSSKRLI